MKKSILLALTIISIIACKKEDTDTVAVEDKGEMSVSIDGDSAYNHTLTNCKFYIDTVRFGSGQLLKQLKIVSENEDITQNLDHASIIYYYPYSEKLTNTTALNYQAGIENYKGIHASRKKDGIRTSVMLNSNTLLQFTSFTKDKISGTFQGGVKHQQGIAIYTHVMNVSFIISGKNIKSFIN